VTEESKNPSPKIENLELNKETLQDLSEPDTNEARGGMAAPSRTCNTCGAGEECRTYTCWPCAGV
jgi:hypothetical protein